VQDANAEALSVLVVDDHRDTTIAISRLLTMRGYHVHTALTYQDALDAARHNRVDLLLTDIGLKGGDGCNLLGEIALIHPIRGIAITGYGMPEDQRRFEQAGFAAVLVKPISIDSLQDAITAVTTGSRATC
jgi:CheY-like chemotaxis protein